MRPRTLGLLLLAVLAGPALAQSTTVWRCGPDGRLFSDRPCPGEGRRTAVADDTPTPEARAQAREVAEREAALADLLRAERLERESAGPVMVVLPVTQTDWNRPTVAEQAFGHRRTWRDGHHKPYARRGKGIASPYDTTDVMFGPPRRSGPIGPSAPGVGGRR